MGGCVASMGGGCRCLSGRGGLRAVRVAVAVAALRVMCVRSVWRWLMRVAGWGLWVVFAWWAAVTRSMRVLNVVASARARVCGRGCAR